MADAGFYVVVYNRLREGRSTDRLTFEQAVEQFTYLKGEVLTTFTDIESSKKNERPQLQAAITYCKVQGQPYPLQS